VPENAGGAVGGLIQEVTQDRYPIKRDALKALKYRIYFYEATSS
jgi:hypothetical protein